MEQFFVLDFAPLLALFLGLQWDGPVWFWQPSKAERLERPARDTL